MAERIKISLPIVVEGKYDKSTLLSIFDTTVITLGGFAVFNSKEKQALLRKVAKDGIIPKEKIYNLYIPKIAGKEKRKASPSKEGLLGVEGMGREELVRVLTPFIVGDDGKAQNDVKRGEMITKVDFYMDKLSGADNSSARRDELARRFELPDGMTANALLEALNIITDKEGYRLAVASLLSE